MNSEGTKDLGEDALALTGFGSDLFERSVANTGMHSLLVCDEETCQRTQPGAGP